MTMAKLIFDSIMETPNGSLCAYLLPYPPHDFDHAEAVEFGKRSVSRGIFTFDEDTSTICVEGVELPSSRDITLTEEPWLWFVDTGRRRCLIGHQLPVNVPANYRAGTNVETQPYAMTMRTRH